MANIASSKKDARRSARRAAANRSVRSAVKTRIAKVRRALTEGGGDPSALAVEAIASLDRAASKGILHPNNAARRKSRLMKRLNSAQAAPAAAAPTGARGAAASGRASTSRRRPRA
jgi:small subunit ribosomal protein S20